MARTVIVKPASGLVVRDPVTYEPLPAGGAPKEMSSHWIRRRNAGDVTIEEAPAVPATKVAKPATSAA